MKNLNNQNYLLNRLVQQEINIEEYVKALFDQLVSQTD